MRKLPAPAALLVSLAALTACAYPNPQHVAALNTLIGRPEPDLIRARGVPTRTYQTSGLKFLAYDMRHIETIPGDPGFGPAYGYGYGYGGGLGGYGYGGFGGVDSEIIQRDCETTFELKAGTVQSWSLRGNDC